MGARQARQDQVSTLAFPVLVLNQELDSKCRAFEVGDFEVNRIYFYLFVILRIRVMLYQQFHYLQLQLVLKIANFLWIMFDYSCADDCHFIDFLLQHHFYFKNLIEQPSSVHSVSCELADSAQYSISKKCGNSEALKFMGYPPHTIILLLGYKLIIDLFMSLQHDLQLFEMSYIVLLIELQHCLAYHFQDISPILYWLQQWLQVCDHMAPTIQMVVMIISLLS